MSVIHRNVTRVILNATEVTQYTRTPSGDLLPFELTASDKLYLGFYGKFTSRYFDFDTLNATGTVVSVKQWDGTAFVPVEDVIDQTVGFTRSGFLSWQNTDRWEKSAISPIDDKELYWVEVTVNSTLDVGTTLQSLVNIFCDTDLLRAFYPEIVTDPRYLPTGRDDFMEQFIAAKDGIVLRLKQDGIIQDESQIIDINQVAVAAANYTAYLILFPIARDEGDEETLSRAFSEYNRQLNSSHKSFDLNKSGKIDESEENIGTVYIQRGG